MRSATVPTEAVSVLVATTCDWPVGSVAEADRRGSIFPRICAATGFPGIWASTGFPGICALPGAAARDIVRVSTTDRTRPAITPTRKLLLTAGTRNVAMCLSEYLYG